MHQNLLKKVGTACLHMALSMSALSAVGATQSYYRTRRGSYSAGRNQYVVDPHIRPISTTSFTQRNSAVSKKAAMSVNSAFNFMKGQRVRELLIVDGSVQNKSLVFNQAKPGVEVVEIKAGQGMNALLEILGKYAGLDAVHIVSHAKSGTLQIGDEKVDQKTIENNVATFAIMNNAIREGGDLMLYGCNLAKGSKGENFLKIIKENTHVDVAASLDKTGNEAYGGNWELEIQKGDIKAKPLPESIAMNDFTGTLQFTGTIDFSQVKNPGDAYGGSSVNAEFYESAAKNYILIVDGLNGGTDNYYDTGVAATHASETSVTLRFSNSEAFDPQSILVNNWHSNPHTFNFASDKGDSKNISFANGETKTVDLSDFADDISSLTISSDKVYVTLDNFEVENVGGSSNSAPTASNVTFTGTLEVGETLTGDYDYSDADSDTESGSTFKWYRSDDASGTNKTAISGATSKTYSLVSADEGKYISFEVTPHDGTAAGTAEESSPNGPVIQSVLLSSSPTLTFTANSADITGDNIASDGEGGSQSISDIDIQIFNISNADGTFLNSLSWQNNDFLYSNDAGYSGLTREADAGSKGMSVKSADGSEFRLIQFKYYNWGESTSFTNTIKGYRGGTEVASMTFAGLDPDYDPITVSLDASFSNVDDVRIYISAGGYVGDQSATNHSINNIQVTSPVSAAPPTVSTTTQSDVTATSATLGGNVTDDGGAAVTERGVVYSSSDATPEIGEGDVTKDTNGSGTGSFSESISGLSAETTYYVRAYATNSEGTSYGSVESFTTTPLTTDITITTSASSGSGWSISGGELTATASVLVNYQEIENTLAGGDLMISSSRDIIIDADVAPALSAHRTLTLKADRDIAMETNSSIAATGFALNTIFWSDADASEGGMAYLKTQAEILTNGGHLWIGGGNGSTTWNGLTVGDGTAIGNANNSNGITLVNTNIQTDGGSIAFYGKGMPGAAAGVPILISTGSSTNTDGIRMHDGNSIDAGSGTIYMYGFADNSHATSNANGIELSQTPGAGDVITSSNNTGNAIFIEAYAEGPATVANSWGFYTHLSTIQNTGGGNIHIKGSAIKNAGVTVASNGAVLANSGKIILEGTASGASSYAVFIQGAVGQKTGTSVLSSSADIEIIGDKLSISGTAPNGSIQSSGVLAIRPYTVGTDIGIGSAASTLQLPASYFNTNFVDGFSEIIVGDENTGLITVEGATVYQDPLTLKTDGSIVFTADADVSTAAANTLTLWTRAGGNNEGTDTHYGAIWMPQGASINTEGGDLTMGGGADPNTGYAMGDATAPAGENNARYRGVTMNGAIDAAGGNIIINARGAGNITNTRGASIGGSVKTNGTGNITIRGIGRGTSDAIALGDSFFTPDAEGILEAGSGNITLISEPSASTRNGFNLSTSGSYVKTNGDFSTTTTGRITATAGALDIGGNTNLEAGDNIVLTHASNDFDGSITVNGAANLEITDQNELSLGEISVSGTIEIATLGGDLTLTENITTTDASADAIQLFADKTKNAGDSSGGNIKISGTPAISTGAGGQARFYSGSILESADLITLVGEENTRYEIDATTTVFDPVLGSGSYALLREEEGFLLSTSPTLSFSDNSGFTDNIVQDGEGGSVNISDMNIQILPVNSSGTKLVSDPVEYHDNNDWPGYPAIITYGNVNPHYGWSIKSDNGDDFSLVKVDFHDWGGWEGDTFVAEAFLDGSSKGTITFTGNTDGSYIELSNSGLLTSIFGKVDEVRLFMQGGTDAFIALNNVQVTTPVGNTAPTDISLSSTSVNQSGGSNAVVGSLSTTDADGSDTHTYSLVAGTGDDDNSSFNINGSDLRADDASTLAGGTYSVRIQTDDGTDTFAKEFEITVMDDVAPSFENSTPALSDILVDGGTLSADLDEDGTVYFIVVADGDGAPSAAQVKSGQNSVGSAALSSGNFTTSSTTGSKSFTGLASSTDFDLYVVAEDDEATPNLQDSPTKLDFSNPEQAKGLAFDGTDDKVTTTISLTSANYPNLTTETWFKPERLNHTDYQGIIGDDKGGFNSRQVWMNTDNKIVLSASGSEWTLDFTVETGKWYHIAVVYSPDEIKAYINGVEFVNENGSTNTSTGTMAIGVGYNQGQHFQGVIDEVRIWDVARTQSEIESLKGTELDGDEANLIHYFDFNQGVKNGDNTGLTTLEDRVSGGSDGTLENFALNGSSSNWVDGNEPAVPTVISSAASDVGGTEATLNGEVTNDGGSAITERGFVYSLTDDDPTPSIAEVDGTSVIKKTVSGTTGEFSTTLSGLNSLSEYSFVAYAINAAGISYGSEKSFTTPGAPSFTSIPVTEVDYDHAYSYGIVATQEGDLETTLSAATLPDWLEFSTDGQNQASQFGNVPDGVMLSGVAGDENGNIYAIRQDGTEIFKIAPDGTTTSWKSGLISGLVYALHIADGYIYIPRYSNSTESITRIPLNDPSATEETFASFPGGALSLTDKDGWVYAADWNSAVISRVNQSTLTVETLLTNADGIPSNGPFGLTFDEGDNLYIVTWNSKSILKYDGTAVTTVLSGLPNPVSSIRVDKKDDFYISMSGGGIRKYNSDFSDFEVVSPNDTDNIWSLSFTHSGALVYAIFSTNGVYRLQTGAVLTGTPAKSDVGEHEVVLKASNDAGNSEQTFTIRVLDNVAPVVDTYSPAHQATEVALAPTLSLTFDEAVVLGNEGTLKLYAGGSAIQTYDLSVAAGRDQFSLSADKKTLSLSLEENLPLNTEISVEIENGATGNFVEDTHENAFVGFTAASETWTFTTADNNPPTASNVTFSGTLEVGEELTGSYDYADDEEDAEDGTAFQWYRSDDASGVNKAAIADADAITYTLAAADEDKYISFEVTPHDGTNAGTAEESSRQGPVTNPAPDIQVKGNDTGIANGSNTPSTNDYTDFGSVAAAEGSFSRTFAIENTGTTDLALTDDDGRGYVTIDGTHADDFMVSEGPSSTIAPGNATTFTITFDPAAVGERSATVNIHSDDPDETPYTFAILGNGSNTAPEASNVDISGTLKIGDVLTGTYDFSDADAHEEDGSTFQWYRSEDAQGTDKTAIAGANAKTYTLLAADQNKYLSFEVIPNDGMDAGTAVESALLLIQINDAPTFTAGNDQSVLEDAGLQTIEAWATNISAGQEDESDQVLTFNVSNDNESLFAVQPAIAANGTLTYTPADDAHGTANVSVSLSDDGGTSNGGEDTSEEVTFTITVTPVNDTPSFTAGGDRTVPAGAASHHIAGWARDISAGANNENAQQLTFHVSNDQEAFFTTQPAINNNGNLSFTLAEGVSGSVTVTVSLSDDGGTANGGQDTSEEITFTINIGKLSQTITFEAIDDKMVGQDPVALNATGGDSGLPVTYTVTTDPASGVASLADNTIVIENVGTVTVTATQAGNELYEAAASVSRTFSISANELFLPTLFTPNGDGNNDRFILRGGGGVTTLTFSILDRDNNLVYQTTNWQELTQQGWDGTHNGKKQPLGTYVWVINGKYTTGLPLLVNGKNTGIIRLLR